MSINFEKVNYIYSANTPFAYHALKDIDLDINIGKMTAIIGATGSGKTTLVQHLNALLLPYSGTVNVLDNVITNDKKTVNIKELRQKVGLVFQFAEYQLFEETLIKDVSFGPKNFGVSVEEAEKIAVNCLLTVGIKKEDFEKSPLELSGGQKRRVAIAGILAMNPEILVLDEPTAGLDPQGARYMMNLFQELNKRGITVIIVTHNMDHVLEYCDDVVVVENGKIKVHTDKKSFFEDEKYMREANIDPPAVIQLKTLLKEKGVDISDDIIEFDDLMNEIIKKRRKK